jgi:predicted metalloprotease
MKWNPGGDSQDLEDRRGAGGGGFGVGRAMPLGIGGVILLAVLSLATGKNFFALLDDSGGVDPSTGSVASAPVSASPDEQKMKSFVSFVLDDVQHTWDTLLPGRYTHTKLVLFRDAIQSGCGFAEEASGPFYCPEDRKVYIDLGFYEELKDRFGAPGDFAQAYVLAHEIGHHVQAILGTEQQVRDQQQADPRAANDLSVRLELQADCYAGIWGHSTEQRNILEQGDIEEGLNAAAAVGDDRIQKMTTGRVMPDRFTHGTSAQRVTWFKSGFDSGRLDACNTFAR